MKKEYNKEKMARIGYWVIRAIFVNTERNLIKHGGDRCLSIKCFL